MLANDTDVDGDTLTVTTLTPTAAHGTVACTAAGACTYTPRRTTPAPTRSLHDLGRPRRHGHGQRCDHGHGEQPPTRSTTRSPPPRTRPRTGECPRRRHRRRRRPAHRVLAHARPRTHGTVSCSAAGGTARTRRAPNYNGPDAFDYTVSDGHGGTDTGHVTMTVTPVNDDPNAVDNSLTTAEDTARVVNVLANDTDVDGDSLTVTTAAPAAAHGTVSCTAPASARTRRPRTTTAPTRSPTRSRTATAAATRPPST